MCRQYPHIQWVHHPSRDLRDPPNRVNGVLMNHMLIEQKEGKRNRSAVLNHAIFFFFLTADAHAARHRFGGEVRRKRSEMPTRRRNRMTPLAAIFRGSSLFFFTQGVEDGFQHINGVIDDERSEP